ncbi:MAG TPA: ABC transporter permease [Ilumatobacteraceae bacterium]|nr:ABC transporter permease [Ilumatobacteraceae bacterium]
MILLTFRDLVYRKTRFIVVTILGAVVFALLFVMTGLVNQFNLEPAETVEQFGADQWVLPEGVSAPFTSVSVMPAAAFDAVEATTKSPVVISRSSVAQGGEPEEVVLVGFEADGLGMPQMVEGRAPGAAGEVALDRSLDIDIGADITVAGAPFTVVGLTEATTVLAGIPFAYLTLPEAQMLAFTSTEVISSVLVAGELGPLPAGLTSLSSDAVVAQTLQPLEGAIASIDLVRALLWIVAAIIVGAVVYLSALDRQRDFAVLKAVGAPNSSLLGSLALQAVLIALGAVALAAIIQVFLAPRFPLPVTVPARAFWQLPVLAVVMALAAGAIGMRKVLRSDPSQAFSGAGA